MFKVVPCMLHLCLLHVAALPDVSVCLHVRHTRSAYTTFVLSCCGMRPQAGLYMHHCCPV